MRTLTDAKIQKQFVGDSRFGGVLNKDDLSKLQRKAYIFNLDKRSGPGTHWVMVWNCDPNYVLYFDSFGEPAPVHISALMNATHKRIIESGAELQGLRTDSCGEWCIFMVKNLMKGYKPTQILSWFTDSSNENEIMLQKYFRQPDQRLL
jgi:hypothetical protein